MAGAYSGVNRYMDKARSMSPSPARTMMDISGGSVSMSTNGFHMQQIAPYPERMIWRLTAVLLSSGV